MSSPNIKASVKQQFSQVAAKYSVSQVHAAGEDLQTMVTAAHLRGDERVLDAGCGAGHTALTFAPHVYEVVAFDLSNEMLAQVETLAAARGITNIRTQRGDVENLPFENGEFDLVTSRYSAHHWPHPERALAEIRRVLVDNGSHRGRFLLADIISFDDYSVDSYFQAIEILRDPSHVRDHTLTQWLTIFSAAGFIPQVIAEWPVPIDFDDWVERMETPADNVAMLRKFLDEGPAEVKQALAIQPSYDFSIRGALIGGAQT